MDREKNVSEVELVKCYYCGKQLRGYYYTCHFCGKTYCYIHMPKKCDHLK